MHAYMYVLCIVVCVGPCIAYYIFSILWTCDSHNANSTNACIDGGITHSSLVHYPDDLLGVNTHVSLLFTGTGFLNVYHIMRVTWYVLVGWRVGRSVVKACGVNSHVIPAATRTFGLFLRAGIT